ncbi:MAG: hypothetical protein DME22_23775 [Verrucomicrobia bacterium]|nr:MAG: hypothetical protein DME22_23775 [Verrucomicrobiota bacterium]
MKKTIALLLTFVSLASAQAQGTLQFTVSLNGGNEVPPNSSPYTASGTLTLSGNTLNYSMGRNAWDFLPTSAGIYGPATESQNASIIFDLGSYILSPNPPTMSYIGAVTVTSQQINDLEGGLWYVNFNSSSFPNGEIRGQIIPVPEPSALALLAVGGTLAALLRRRKLRQ